MNNCVKFCVQRRWGALHVNKIFSKMNHDRTTIFKQYLSHDEVNQYLTDLVQNYANKVEIFSRASSYEGREIQTVRISPDVQRKKTGRFCVLIDAGIHAREWITISVALYVVHQLVERDAINSRVLRNFDWIVLPLLNPDGYEYSREHVMLYIAYRSVLFQPRVKLLHFPEQNVAQDETTPGSESMRWSGLQQKFQRFVGNRNTTVLFTAVSGRTTIFRAGNLQFTGHFTKASTQLSILPVAAFVRESDPISTGILKVFNDIYHYSGI